MKNKKTQPTLKWVICLFIVFTFMQTSAQQNSITLTFSAIDSVSHEDLTIDSVMILNLSKLDSTIVQGPNPQIALVWTGIDEAPVHPDATFQATGCFPNPFYSSSTVAIDVYQQQELHLRLLNQTGRVMAEMKDHFTPGRHIFRVSAGNHNICFLSVNGGGKSDVIKLISLAEGDNRIEYSGQQEL